MIYSLSQKDKEIYQGQVIAKGTTVYEMTEDVAAQLSDQYDLTDLAFEDVSNYWTFTCLLQNIPTILSFRPEDEFADKFGLED